MSVFTFVAYWKSSVELKFRFFRQEGRKQVNSIKNDPLAKRTVSVSSYCLRFLFRSKIPNKIERVTVALLGNRKIQYVPSEIPLNVYKSNLFGSCEYRTIYVETEQYVCIFISLCVLSLFTPSTRHNRSRSMGINFFFITNIFIPII